MERDLAARPQYALAVSPLHHAGRRLEGDDGRIIHAEISIHGSALMLGDADAPFSPPSAIGASVALHVYVPDVDALTAQAVAAGAELLTPPTDMSYGARQSMLRDPFGHIWIS